MRSIKVKIWCGLRGDDCLGQHIILSEDELKKYLEELKSSRIKTKFFLVKILVDLGMGWHSLDEIRKSAMERGVSVSHLFENLLEICHGSDFLETDFKEKYYPRLTSFKIKDEAFPLLRNILQDFDTSEGTSHGACAPQ